MDLGTHAAFILASYMAAALLIGGLIVSVILDYRAQQRALAALERQGVTRRSSAGMDQGV